MTGIVEYNLDPKHQGRIKVRVFGMNDQKSEDGKYIIPTEMLPWARPRCNGSGGSVSGSGTFSIPKIGSTVYVEGTLNNPIWNGNMYVSNEVVTELSEGNYTNSHILIYDTDFNNGDAMIRDEYIKVYFTDSKGFQIEYKTVAGIANIGISNTGTIQVIGPHSDAITIENGTINIVSGNTVNIDAPLVNLSDQATESVLKGETVKEIFNAHTHTCNSGETTAPMQKMTDVVLNRHVKI